MARRWPKAITVHATIAVVLVTEEEMRDHAGDHDAPAAMWDDDLATIYVQRNLTRRERWEELGHEVDHAGLDIMRRALWAAAGEPVG